MPRRNKPKDTKYRPAKSGGRCGVTYRTRDQAPRGVPIYQCKRCGAFHPAKAGKRRGR